MSKTQTKKAKKDRKAKTPATLPARFEPKFLESVDGRQTVIKEIKKRLERLKQDCGCDSFQKEILCERAVFLSTLLQTQEIAGYESKPLDQGSYVQTCNGLLGILKALGLNKAAAKIGGLREYVEGKAG